MGTLPRVSRASANQALLLAAVSHAFLAALRSDLPPQLQVPLRKRWPRWRTQRPHLVVAHRLSLMPPPKQISLSLPLATHEFVSKLPSGLVRQVAEWAPPVISALPVAGPDVPVPVLENLVSAFLAARVTPDQPVWVRVLAKPSPAKFSLAALAEFSVPLLAPIVERYRNRVVVEASSIEVAQLLAGLGRAMAARIRQRAKPGVGAEGTT